MEEGDRVHRFCMITVVFLSCICCIVQGAAIAEAEDCGLHDHEWIPYQEDIHGSENVQITLEETNDSYHLYTKSIPERVCQICGVCEYLASGGSYEYHSYRVTDWRYENEGVDVKISWVCERCDYERTEIVPIQSIIDGMNAECILGGKCNESHLGYVLHDGVVPNDALPAEAEWFTAVLYSQERSQFRWVIRMYCPGCGRPAIGGGDQYGVFQESFNGVPIMTEEYFLTVDMPENLPYQLIDQLRAEAQAG